MDGSDLSVSLTLRPHYPRYPGYSVAHKVGLKVVDKGT